MKTILVTGGCGFIGSHTCLSLLETGYNLIVVDSNINSSPGSIESIKNILLLKGLDIKKKITFFKGDIREVSFLKDVFKFAKNNISTIDAVIHFAGLKAVGDSVNVPSLYWDVNVGGSLSLLKVMGEYGCRSIVFSSSASIYGNNSEKSLLETSNIIPCNPYSRTKQTVENILDDIFNASKDKWRIAILRYFNPIGAHCSGLIGEDPNDKPNNLFPYICAVALGKFDKLNVYGKDWPTPDGTGIRDYIHVMDLAESHLSALNYILESNPQIIKLNIGTGRGTSVLDLINTFIKVNGCEVPYIFSKRRKGDVPILVANNNLALSKLGWHPKRNLEDMCKDGWKWIKNNPYGYKKI